MNNSRVTYSTTFPHVKLTLRNKIHKNTKQVWGILFPHTPHARLPHATRRVPSTSLHKCAEYNKLYINRKEIYTSTLSKQY